MIHSKRVRSAAAVLTAMLLTVPLAGCSVEDMKAAAETQDVTASSGSEAASSERGTGQSYISTGDAEHALSLEEGEASYDGILVTKTGDGEGDEADFYGTNAAVYAENGAKLSITNAQIQTNGSHANAVFSYGEGTEVLISDSTIETEKNNSGGIMVTGGGKLTANNLTVTTQGGSSAPIRSDRGGGEELVNGGTYTSYGSGSPAIYSTADVTVKGAKLYADVSQAVVVEGKNSVTLIDTDATGKNTKKNSDNSSRCQAVMVYQSMSGDASEGCGTFTMTGGSLTSLYEGMFFVTNTVAEITLTDVELHMASEDLLRIEAAGWGNEGSNGGQVTFTAKDQKLEGIITVDEISTLNLLLENSSFEGSIDSSGQVYVELGNGATWKLTGDASITALTCDADAIDLNGHKLTVGGSTYEEGTASTGEKIEVKITESSGKKDGGKPGEGGQFGHGEDGNKPPEKPDGDDSDTPPAKPDGDDGNRPPEKPEGDGGEEPPTKPEGE